MVAVHLTARELGRSLPGDLAFLVPVIMSTAALVAMFVSSRPVGYRTAQVVRYLAGAAVFVAGTGGDVDASAYARWVFFWVLLLELGALERYPWNLIWSLVVATAGITFRSAVVLAHHDGDFTAAGSLLAVAVAAYIIAVLASTMVRFREGTVDLQRENETLQEVVANMARANTRYQSVAVLAGERGRSQERRRITRDIHDVVGYTLTNNIMLMETARDMMQENPLGIPKLVDAARANAEEGLARIRDALYDLRRQEDQAPIGLVAIQRLVKTFGEATGVSVRLDWANAPARLPDAVDSALYHLVQESLINSYRHGKVTSVEISCWCEEDSMHVYLRDDGIGATNIREGIGISGMRERITLLCGDLSVSGRESGFLVQARLPLRVEQEEHD